jgi:hypothetical protein
MERKEDWNKVSGQGNATQRMKGNRETHKFFSITLHLGCPPHPCPKRCLYTILKRLRRLNFVEYGIREVGKRAQRNPTRKWGIILFFNFF